MKTYQNNVVESEYYQQIAKRSYVRSSMFPHQMNKENIEKHTRDWNLLFTNISKTSLTDTGFCYQINHFVERSHHYADLYFWWYRALLISRELQNLVTINHRY